MGTNETNYIERYDAANDADKSQLVLRWMQDDPLPFFKELREKRPILATPGFTVLAQFDDVIEVLDMPKIFTVALYRPEKGESPYLMGHDDDALHTREKSIMQGMLNRDDLPRVRNMVEKIANGILNTAHGRIEAVNDYCRMVPMMLVEQYFGLTGGNPKELIECSYWTQYNMFHNQPFQMVSDAEHKRILDRSNRAAEILTKYITELVVHRLLAVKAEQAKNILFSIWYLFRKFINILLGKKQDPVTDDILTRMLRTSYPEAMNFDIKRLAINANGLLIGAIETTSQAVAQTIQYLLENSKRLEEAIRAAKEPDTSVFDGIVWETLRFVPIAPYLFRQAGSEYTVAKGTKRATTIKAGTYVLPLTQSAMFDPKAFENPDEFIAGRNWYHYFHFGFGSHDCLGKYVGMVMIPEMVRQILARPGIKAHGKIDFKSGPFPEQYALSWDAS